MKKIFYIATIIGLLATQKQQAQLTPADTQTGPITILGATAHVGNGEVIENSILIFENGKLTTVAPASADIRPQGKIIDAKGKQVYPGFIIPNATLGLGEIDAVRASLDENEIGQMIPNVRSLIAYNAESQVVESMRPNGILLAQVTPRGGTISGTSSVVQLDAWNWEDAAVKTDDGIHMNWPDSFTRARRFMGEDSGMKPNEKYGEVVQKIKDFLQAAYAYSFGKKEIKNLAYQAADGLFDGLKTLYVHTGGAREITDAVLMANELGIKKVVLVGAAEAYKTIELLKKYNVAVLAERTQSEPGTDDADYDLPYKLPKLLTDNGILVGLENSGDMERMNSRNLPFYAGQVVGQGMDKETALQLITFNTAKILGIDKTYGSLEVGKSATLFICDGDALDMRTNKLTHAFIDGRQISLQTHQTKLYERYKEKYQKEGLYK
ncbi:MAG: amidohydrolase family protein [Flavobacteriaceae bacterium]|nr:amidohydrolase family protein [Flavobacteriaceae bacterium]